MPEVLEFRGVNKAGEHPAKASFSEAELRLRRRAVSIVEQLPENVDDAERVLELAQEIIGSVLRPKRSD